MVLQWRFCHHLLVCRFGPDWIKPSWFRTSGGPTTDCRERSGSTQISLWWRSRTHLDILADLPVVGRVPAGVQLRHGARTRGAALFGLRHEAGRRDGAQPGQTEPEPGEPWQHSICQWKRLMTRKRKSVIFLFFNQVSGALPPSSGGKRDHSSYTMDVDCI